MYLSFGTHRRPSREAALTGLQRSIIRSDRGHRAVETVTMQVEGLIHADTPSQLAAEIADFETTLASDPEGDVGLYFDTGSPAQVLSAGDALGGIAVLGWSWLDDPPGQFVTYRKYSVSFQASYLNTNEELLLFRESLRVGGGGPRVVFLEAITGLPQKQITAQKTTYRATQSGEAIGSTRYPSVPSPLFPAAMIEEPDVEEEGADNVRGSFTNFRIRWTYRYESDRPLIGHPHTK